MLGPLLAGQILAADPGVAGPPAQPELPSGLGHLAGLLPQGEEQLHGQRIGGLVRHRNSSTSEVLRRPLEPAVQLPDRARTGRCNTPAARHGTRVSIAARTATSAVLVEGRVEIPHSEGWS